MAWADRVGAGNAVTAYGSSGIKGPSGAAVLGGLPTDSGKSIAHTDVVKSMIPAESGYMTPAEQVR